MPLARVGDIDLYFEVHGAGPPLLLLEGLGYSLWMWDELLPELARRFQVIAFDNRGVGRSDKPPGPYSTAGMADDAAGLLARLGVARAHVLGISMGGMIAQEMVIRHPALVDRLILGATSFGGPESVPAPPETRALLMADPSGVSPEEAVRRNMEVAFAPGWTTRHPDAFDRWVRRRLEWLPPREAWLAQFHAILGHDTSNRLGTIDRPTLVCSGDQDRVVPVENSRRLAARIPGVRLVLFQGAGHLFFIEQAEQFTQVLVDFLEEAD